MPAIVRGTVPAEEFALSVALERLPSARFRIERVVECGDDAVMPLVWVRGDDDGAVRAALEADPTVEEPSLLGTFDEELLFRTRWDDSVGRLVDVLTDAEATILDAYGADGRWELRLLFPDHEAVSRAHDGCAAHGLTFSVESIGDLDGGPAGRHGLTDDQYEALALAAECGFFDVPRSVTLQELADEAGVSHQALSERLRRGMEVLVEDTLLVEPVGEREQ